MPSQRSRTPQLEDMLTCHEIGHALFDDYEELVRLFPENSQVRKYFSYFNVTDDVRIERKTKEKYPGTRKVFREGYKLLHDMDFFNLSETSWGDCK